MVRVGGEFESNLGVKNCIKIMSWGFNENFLRGLTIFNTKLLEFCHKVDVIKFLYIHKFDIYIYKVEKGLFSYDVPQRRRNGGINS